MASERSGHCLCGAVHVSAKLHTDAFGACHCEMCRRWTGSALLAVSAPSDELVWRGEENIARFQSSPWAERAFCRICGTLLFYRITDSGTPFFGNHELPIGLFDDANGLKMESEIYYDEKPDAFEYAGDAKKLSRAETLALIGVSDEPEAASPKE